MKTNLALSNSLACASFVLLLASNATAATPSMPSKAAVLIERAAGGGAGFIVVSNSANEIWSVESSTNLLIWFPVGTMKIHNGRGRRALTDAAAQPGTFFNSGVVDNPNLPPPLRNPPGQPPGARRLNLSPGEKAALVAFLRTLTDPTLATDVKYSDPFNYED